MASQSEDLKLIIRVINFELFQPICPGYINVTDGQTDGRTTYDSNTALALRASRGKNKKWCYLDELTMALHYMDPYLVKTRSCRLIRLRSLGSSSLCLIQVYKVRSNWRVFWLSSYAHLSVLDRIGLHTRILQVSFYRAMHVVLARYCCRVSSVRLSVCPSVTLRYRGHIGWISPKLVTRIISLGSSLLGYTASAI